MSIVGELAAGLGGLANAHNSDSQNTSVGDSWGSSASQSWNKADSVADAWSASKSDSWGDSWGYNAGESNSNAYNWSKTYGSEATAKSIELAAEQNRLQHSLWNEAADYNTKQAQEQMAFQERMSNTAYQRAVIDLLAAGLNPILAVGNMGASTPVGAMGSMSSATAYRGDVFADQESYGSSSSRAWERGESGSHNEAHSWSKSKSHSESHERGGSTSSSSQGSHNESQGTSKTRTQIKELVNAVSGLMSGGSSKSNTVKNNGGRTGGGQGQ